MRRVDVAVIGAGTAGLGAFHAAKRRSSSVVLIEGGAYGTTCAREGCMPSKLLIAAAEAAQAARTAHRFGADRPREPVVDGVKVLERVRSERDRFVSFVVEDTLVIPEADRLHGMARFLDERTLDVGGQQVRARAVVVATGSRPRSMPALDALGDRVSTSDDLFSWRSLPASVLVVGAGAVGLELGQALAFLGVRVRVVGRGGALGPITDRSLRADALEALRGHLSLHPSSEGLTLDRVEGGVRARFRDETVVYDEVFERVLSAIGRVPNLETLRLDLAGVPLDDAGQPQVDPYTLRAGETSIYLAGDVAGIRRLLHEASFEGRLAGTNAAAHPEPEVAERMVPIGVVFCHPNLAAVGVEFDPSAQVCGRVSFVNQGRARVMGVNEGALHVYACRSTGRVVGAQLAGPRGEHLAHLLAWSIQAGHTLDALLRMPFYHPVIEEGLRTALRDAVRQLKGSA